jgi:sialate O-acetylesterase
MSRRLAALLVVFVAFAVHAANAQVKASALFSDHAVLLSGAAVPVWGTASVGEKVTVTIDGKSATAVTDAAGKWMAHLPRLKAGGPFEMTIQGRNTITVEDVLVGEVWLGSGQSNMQFPVSVKHAYYAGMLDEEKEIAAANYPQIRMFTGKPTTTYELQTEAVGEWKICTPENVGDFSAVGYLFARDLQRELKVPVGIVLEAYGASTAEAWVPREQLAAQPRLAPMLELFDKRVAFFRAHPEGVSDAEAPAGPQTLNARPSKPGPMRDPTRDQHQPTVLYNAMIHPIVPYAIRGVLWYQGESIVGGRNGVATYPLVMETLVKDWRRAWQDPTLPFFAVQLAALDNVSNNPAVREAQARILELPNTGLAITIDIGDEKNVHPKNKAPLGERLTLIALAKVYGKRVEYSGPVYTGMAKSAEGITLRFSHAAGLMAKDGPLKWFQIAGSDGKFVDAEAEIKGQTVVVHSPAMTNPASVRYAWANYPLGANLYNAAGLPASPFRTDQTDALGNIAQQFTGK